MLFQKYNMENIVSFFPEKYFSFKPSPVLIKLRFCKGRNVSTWVSSGLQYAILGFNRYLFWKKQNFYFNALKWGLVLHCIFVFDVWYLFLSKSDLFLRAEKDSYKYFLNYRPKCWYIFEIIVRKWCLIYRRNLLIA